jgi:siroheme synthase-like protein
MNTKFPIFLKPESLTFNVFGGSEIAEEKLHFLLKSSPHAHVRVFASSFSEPVQGLIDRHPNVRAIPRWRAWPWQVGRNDVSIVATIEPREVKWSVGLGRLMGHLLNVADVPDRCDFYMGGIVTNGSLKLAISTDGKAPILAKRMREWLEDVLPEDVESNLDELQALRRELKGDFAQKQATLRALTRHFRDQQAS